MNCPNCEKTIHEHEATRCLDAWIAERVFEFEVFDDARPKGVKFCGITAARFYYRSEFRHPSEGWPPVPEYSMSMNDAWKIVEKVTEEYWLAEIWLGHAMDGDKFTTVEFRTNCNVDSGRDVLIGEQEMKRVEGKAHKSPLAICRAALKAVSE